MCFARGSEGKVAANQDEEIRVPTPHKGFVSKTGEQPARPLDEAGT